MTPKARCMPATMSARVIGGLIGMALGLAASAAIGTIGGWGFIVSPVVVAAAVGFSLAVGVAENRGKPETVEQFRGSVVIGVSPPNPLPGEHDAAGRGSEKGFSLPINTQKNPDHLLLPEDLHPILDISAADEHQVGGLDHSLGFFHITVFSAQRGERYLFSS